MMSQAEINLLKARHAQLCAQYAADKDARKLDEIANLEVVLFALGELTPPEIEGVPTNWEDLHYLLVY